MSCTDFGVAPVPERAGDNTSSGRTTAPQIAGTVLGRRSRGTALEWTIQQDGEMDEDGVMLAGVERVGDTVRRSSGVWTPTLLALLAHLRTVGFGYGPTPLGVDDEGREVVSYITGDAGSACWEHVATDAGVWRFGRLLREYHIASASFSPPEPAHWKLPALDTGPDTVVCHGDFTPWNVVWRNGVPVGIIDWEFARPGSRFDDLAWAAIWSVPLRCDAEAVDGWACWEKPPDRRRRLRVLVDGYGSGVPARVVDDAVRLLRRTAADVHALADRGLEPQLSWVRTGVADQDLNRADWISEHHALLL